MNLNDIKQNIDLDIPDSDIEINPLDILNNFYFRKPASGDYRDKSIQKCIKNKIDFYSNFNCLSSMAKDMISVTCPSCGDHMNYLNCSGGTGSAMTFYYKCSNAKCQCKVSMSLPCDSISVKFD